jgi:acetylornithine deacetylase/succinyl-diaminopimelate desuccinylase-like protein
MTSTPTAPGSSAPTPPAASGAIDLPAVRSAVADAMPGLVADLERLVAIPSCAFPGFPAEPVLQMAEATAQLLRRSGLPEVSLVDVPDGYPVVYGHRAAPPGAPTVLLYAHYDVQPAPPEQGEWHNDPWTPTVRDGRLFGRGAADDKSGIVINAGTLQVLRRLRGDDLPVGVTVVIEGEEECGGHLDQLVASRPDMFRADVCVIADSGNEQVGVPVLDISTRGVVQVDVTVESLRAPVHSGLFGGGAPDALVALMRMVATLHDDAGNVTVTGLHQFDWPGADTDEHLFRRAAGVRDGVALTGDGPLSSRLWSRPAINVIGIDAPSIADSMSALVPRATARLSMRIAPGSDAEREVQTLRDHLRSVAPWGVHATVTTTEVGPSWSTGTDGPAFAHAAAAMAEVYGATPQPIGSGGAIPLLRTLQQVNPDAEFVLWGAEDGAQANIHSANESVDLAELERAVLASCVFCLRLGTGATHG